MRTIINSGTLTIVFNFDDRTVLIQSETAGKYANLSLEAFETCFDSLLKEHGEDIKEG